jgi:Ca-activated chloride channel family protein
MMRALFVLCACHAAASPPAAAPPSLQAGADLDALPPPPRHAARAHAAPPLDLARDRPPVPVSLPQLPEGAAAPLENGWVLHVPGSRQLPAPAYGDGKIFVSGGFEGYEFYALDAEDGHIVWSSTSLEDNGPTAPTYDEDGHVIFNTESCTLFCLDAKTGKKLWFKYLGDPTLSQPAVAGGLVFAAHPSSGGPAFSAYRVKDGAEVWTRVVGGELLAAPVVEGDSVYVATIGGRLFRFLRASGKQLWSQHTGATTAPFIRDGEVFVSRRDRDRETQAVLSAADGRILRTHTALDAPWLADVPNSLDDWKKVWAFEGSRPVVAAGVRYVAMGGTLLASDPSTGALLWQRRWHSNQRSLSTVALAGPALVVSTRSGDLFGLDVDTGYTLWGYRLAHRVSAEPIVAKGWIYTTTSDGRVVALHVSDPTLDGWHMFGGNAAHNGPSS